MNDLGQAAIGVLAIISGVILITYFIVCCIMFIFLFKRFPKNRVIVGLISVAIPTLVFILLNNDNPELKRLILLSSFVILLVLLKLGRWLL